MILDSILSELAQQEGNYQALIPGLWEKPTMRKKINVDYATFISKKLKRILRQSTELPYPGDKTWSDKANVYNMFVRLCTAYDHDGDGQIGSSDDDTTLGNNDLRETGTFLKSIAILPYLHDLGIDTVHLLPITEIGVKGRKGDLGSPYAIKNPFAIDPTLADPVLPGHSVAEQFGGFVEAAHLLGMRVVQEFIFRTTSIDSDWTVRHPEWFYWIRRNSQYGPPKFTKPQLEKILMIPKGKGAYIAPPASYRRMFALPPSGKNIKHLEVASAFADWPPDDIQPPWSDVTYLRLYQYPWRKSNNFNYIAYNTIRYYDPELCQSIYANEPLWAQIVDIIPYFQDHFKIDGAMIDMGHALPNDLKNQIIEKARSKDRKFAFWDENFNNAKETKLEGYNAVIGDAWYVITRRNGFKKLIETAGAVHPLPFFGTAETHNSPRFNPGSRKKEAAWLLFQVLPGAIPFLHNGYELNEQMPVNTGLNFSEEEIRNYSTKPLPLFNKGSLTWNTLKNMVPHIRRIKQIKEAYPWIFAKKQVSVHRTDNRKVLGLKVVDIRKSALILFNTNFREPERFRIQNSETYLYEELLTSQTYSSKDQQKLPAGSQMILVRS